MKSNQSSTDTASASVGKEAYTIKVEFLTDIELTTCDLAKKMTARAKNTYNARIVNLPFFGPAEKDHEGNCDWLMFRHEKLEYGMPVAMAKQRERSDATLRIKVAWPKEKK